MNIQPRRGKGGHKKLTFCLPFIPAAVMVSVSQDLYVLLAKYKQAPTERHGTDDGQVHYNELVDEMESAEQVREKVCRSHQHMGGTSRWETFDDAHGQGLSKATSQRADNHQAEANTSRNDATLGSTGLWGHRKLVDPQVISFAYTGIQMNPSCRWHLLY